MYRRPHCQIKIGKGNWPSLDHSRGPVAPVDGGMRAGCSCKDPMRAASLAGEARFPLSQGSPPLPVTLVVLYFFVLFSFSLREEKNSC